MTYHKKEALQANLEAVRTLLALENTRRAPLEQPQKQRPHVVLHRRTHRRRHRRGAWDERFTSPPHARSVGWDGCLFPHASGRTNGGRLV